MSADGPTVSYRRSMREPEIPDDARDRNAERAAADLARYGLDVRKPVGNDIPYITDSWLKSYQDAPAMAGVGRDVYRANEHDLIESLWDDATWLVATVPTIPDFVAGWMCGEATDRGPIVHYVYTRNSFNGPDGKVPARKQGIATALVSTFLEGMPRGRVWYTHETHLARHALRGKLAPQPGAPGWEYNPWLAWRRVGK